MEMCGRAEGFRLCLPEVSCQFHAPVALTKEKPDARLLYDLVWVSNTGHGGKDTQHAPHANHYTAWTIPCKRDVKPIVGQFEWT